MTDEIASGDDVSGSNYIVTSSYSNGELVRGKPVLSTPTTIVTQESTTETPVVSTQQTVTVTTGMNGSTTSNTNTYSY